MLHLLARSGDDDEVPAVGREDAGDVCADSSPAAGDEREHDETLASADLLANRLLRER